MSNDAGGAPNPSSRHYVSGRDDRVGNRDPVRTRLNRDASLYGVQTPATKRQAEFVYHYTDATGLCGIVSSGRLWATSATALNDTSELRHGFEMCARAFESWEPNLEEAVRVNDAVAGATRSGIFIENTYIVSASSSPYLMNQWTGYATSSGYCLKIMAATSYAPVDSSGPASSEWVKVLYEPADQVRMAHRVFRHIGRGMRRDEAFRAIASLAAILKHPAFAAEQEWRLIASLQSGEHPSFRTRGNQIIPYIALQPAPAEDALFTVSETVPITSVIVGPPTGISAERRMNGLRRYLEAHQIGASIEDSAIPFAPE